MSYAIYKTDAIIMRTLPQGEASIDIVFFTRNLGKILARAQSARKSESKMRMHITRYNQVVIDTVRGKSIWRLTGIAEQSRNQLFDQKFFLTAIHRIMRLSEFLIQGEEPHPELFDFFVNLLHYVSDRSEKESISKSEADGLELFGVVKTLEKLGYWNDGIFPEIPTKEFLEQCASDRKRLVKLINESISMTQIVVS